jgi:DNA-binding CsgD family transcriptional regulator/ligand-binding sensor protein
MTEDINSKWWLSAIGKEKLQAFQDSFAKAFGISLCFLDLQGNPLIVWSNLPLMCDYLIKNDLPRCLRERWKMIRVVQETKQTYFHHCFMGMSYFCSPVYYQDQLVCVAYGGGTATPEKKGFNLLPNQSDAMLAEENSLQNIISLLFDIFNLINLEQRAGTKAKGGTPRELYLQNRLSSREYEVADLLIKGCSNRDIANILFISEKTVKTHVSNILRKLNLKDRRQLAALAVEAEEGGV